jgi:hypothetical protein
MAVLSLALVGAPACDVQEPDVIEVMAVFHTQNADDGAVAFSVTTPPPAAVRSVLPACDGCRAFLYRASDGTAHIVVTGPLATGPVARLQLDNPAPWFAAQLVAVAARGYDSRGLRGYAIAIE